jgi:amidase
MLNTLMTRGVPGERPVISAHEWLELRDVQARLRRQWRRLFESFDAVLAPPFGTVAFEHTDEHDWSRRRLVVNGEATPYADQLAWPGIATFACLPVTVAPIGRDAAGLPIGVQVIGPYLEDRSTIALARAVGELAA